MDLTKSKSRGTSGDMSPSAIERRLELVDELRELALELNRAVRLGPVRLDPAEASRSGQFTGDQGVERDPREN